MSDDEENSEMQSDAVLKPEMQEYLRLFPNCKSLMVKIRMIPNNDNKTPISVINEYAKRTGLNLHYNMPNDMNVGPYYVECKLLSKDRSRVYSDGKGEASTKKEARQIASAHAIESLLMTVREAEFMSSGKSRVKCTYSLFTAQSFCLSVLWHFFNVWLFIKALNWRRSQSRRPSQVLNVVCISW